jgi:hypothetical protein
MKGAEREIGVQIAMSHRGSLIGAFLVCHALIDPNSTFAAMAIDGFSSARHDRFANSGSFLLAGLDLSGVARSSDANGPWATMISPIHFLSADHFHPSVGSMLTFHHDNNAAGASSTRTVVGGARLGNTDVWIGQLNSPIDPSVAVYSIVGPGSYLSSIVYHVGLSASGALGPDRTTDFAVGRNVFDVDFGLVTPVNSTTVTKSGGYIDDTMAGDLSAPFTNGPNLISPDETFFNTFDSGGPSFLLSGSSLHLFGIHAFAGSTSERRVSGDSYLPEYKSSILAAIPEPSTFIAVFVGLSLAGIVKCAGRVVGQRV